MRFVDFLDMLSVHIS